MVPNAPKADEAPRSDAGEGDEAMTIKTIRTYMRAEPLLDLG